MKKFDIKDVFSWSNAENAKKYIGKGGYFADSLKDLQECVSNNNVRQLFTICLEPEIDVDSVFTVSEIDYQYALFLPVEKIKKVEEPKKYRPFTLEEFNKVIPMGTVFKYKYKRNNVNDIYSVYYHANLDGENGFQAIFFENSYHDFDYCFNEMKLFLNGDWKPFGVEDKEQ